MNDESKTNPTATAIHMATIAHFGSCVSMSLRSIGNDISGPSLPKPYLNTIVVHITSITLINPCMNVYNELDLKKND